jgi:methyl coenzyme M reductase gamma subunit
MRRALYCPEANERSCCFRFSGDSLVSLQTETTRASIGEASNKTNTRRWAKLSALRDFVDAELLRLIEEQQDGGLNARNHEVHPPLGEIGCAEAAIHSLGPMGTGIAGSRAPVMVTTPKL